MISHKYKCIFVEVPKTGSSSIREILGYPPKPHLNIFQIQYNLELYWSRYGGVANRLLASAYLLLPEKWRRRRGEKIFQSYFKFGFVRNPWDRAVSLYLRKEGLELRDKMTFEEFVDWMKYSSSTCIHPVPHVNQLDWLVDPHGNVLVDYIGRFENLAADWATIASKIGAPPELPHTRKNPGRNKPYTEYYSERTRRIIEDRFRVDIDYFGYKFGA
jgi:Sulfotransferase family